MAEKNVNIKITSNTDNAQKGINKVTGEINKLTKQANGSGIAKLGKSFGALGAVVAGTVAVVKKAAQTVKELTDAYRVQQKAEVQLEAAARNNPYLNKDSVKQLKQYASEMQKISTHGDEELLPMMAKLAAAGRTQEEIQKIISTALDVEASGMMSLDSAVTALNGTLEGNVGTLGKQIKGLKNLTTEELKSGKAIDEIAGKFGGLAKEVAAQTGSVEQLKNAWGDFKENLGKGLEEQIAPMRKEMTEFINFLNQAMTVEQPTDQLDREEKRVEYQRMINILEEEYKEIAKDATSYNQQDLMAIQQKLSFYRIQLGILQKQEDIEKKIADDKEKQAEADRKREEQQAKDEKALKIMNDNDKALRDRLKKMELEAQLKGEEIDEQKVLNELISSYVSLITTDPSLVSENNWFSKKRLKEIEDFKAGMKGVKEEAEATAEVMTELEKVMNFTSNLSNSMNELQNITADSVELFLGAIKEQTDMELGYLSDQYTEGLISYEEYCDKKKQINRKAAQEEYKLRMWEWTSSLLTATASIAQGIAAALSQTPPMSYINAALTGAAGAIQIATLTANKPRPPAFANGGIVGASMGPDNTVATVRTGEMVLNAMQQKQLWNMANGNGGMAVSMPVTINNTASDKVNASAQLSKNGLTVIISDIVNSQMQKGTYTNSMNIAQSRANGVGIL